MGNVPSEAVDGKDRQAPRQVYGDSNPGSAAYDSSSGRYGPSQGSTDMDTNMDVDNPPPPPIPSDPALQQQQQQQHPPPGAPQENTVPTVFRWEHGGRSVFITGTFNSWTRQIRMHRSGADFTYIHDLTPGKHAFKFIVDDEWRFAPDQPTVADVEGRINNFIDVTDFEPFHGTLGFESQTLGDGGGQNVVDSGHEDDEGDWGLTIPTVDEYTKEPPPLPPHLRHIILNKAPFLTDTAALPQPGHVALNHLYCTAIKDNMMVLGVTGRYKDKFVTTVYYSPCK